MRMRKKKNLGPRMERAGEYLIETPEDFKGRWLQEFSDFKELCVELGCGKGSFTCQMAKMHPDVLFIGIERVAEAAVVGMEQGMKSGIKNLRFIVADAFDLTNIFEAGEVRRIYINFCDPWPGKKRAKRRLTSDGFLKLYKQVLPKNGEIRFKTDNNDLFEYSLERFSALGFELREVTRDLHDLGGGEALPIVEEILGTDRGELDVMTNYETKFHRQGVKINRCVAVNLADPGGPNV